MTETTLVVLPAINKKDIVDKYKDVCCMYLMNNIFYIISFTRSNTRWEKG